MDETEESQKTASGGVVPHLAHELPMDQDQRRAYAEQAWEVMAVVDFCAMFSVALGRLRRISRTALVDDLVDGRGVGTVASIHARLLSILIDHAREHGGAATVGTFGPKPSNPPPKLTTVTSGVSIWDWPYKLRDYLEGYPLPLALCRVNPLEDVLYRDLSLPFQILLMYELVERVLHATDAIRGTLVGITDYDPTAYRTLSMGSDAAGRHYYYFGHADRLSLYRSRQPAEVEASVADAQAETFEGIETGTGETVTALAPSSHKKAQRVLRDVLTPEASDLPAHMHHPLASTPAADGQLGAMELVASNHTEWLAVLEALEGSRKKAERELGADLRVLVFDEIEERLEDAESRAAAAAARAAVAAEAAAAAEAAGLSGRLPARAARARATFGRSSASKDDDSDIDAKLQAAWEQDQERRQRIRAAAEAEARHAAEAAARAAAEAAEARARAEAQRAAEAQRREAARERRRNMDALRAMHKAKLMCFKRVFNSEYMSARRSSSYRRSRTRLEEDTLRAMRESLNLAGVAPPLPPVVRVVPTESAVKLIKPYKRHADGTPVLPATVGKYTVLSLGTVVTDRPGFHAANYIWPVGYKTARTYWTTVDKGDPSEKVLYYSEVLDGGDAPLFRVSSSVDTTMVATETSATAAWSAVVARANKLRPSSTKRQTNSISGPGFFGFTVPTIVHMLQNMPGAEACSAYSATRVAVKGEAGDPAVTAAAKAKAEAEALAVAAARRQTEAAQAAARGGARGEGEVAEAAGGAEAVVKAEAAPLAPQPRKHAYAMLELVQMPEDVFEVAMTQETALVLGMHDFESWVFEYVDTVKVMQNLDIPLTLIGVSSRTRRMVADSVARIERLLLSAPVATPSPSRKRKRSATSTPSRGSSSRRLSAKDDVEISIAEAQSRFPDFDAASLEPGARTFIDGRGELKIKRKRGRKPRSYASGPSAPASSAPAASEPVVTSVNGTSGNDASASGTSPMEVVPTAPVGQPSH
ncbi:uncharacterized protein AMSG_03084 [Thecamonas trahens ATCC 50062]|uniref:Uncharacterized protein n=1 Tax=Thecamonas trahens ATCC 50062 TaxID=461836 RepID=A0A0L0D2V3_THETB|nr:hypothetical protein AMSG_03084 [Thecamonas trahens ATCC 50062]KNC46647.1 hypothetical protein AMSG_03084 [Thecamonas trahens ATCC 50062]|eukprot:XP_013760420.1 hypothetical protein AMSG_03084 [Thecamonas trahens ATCC 50062]